MVVLRREEMEPSSVPAHKVEHEYPFKLNKIAILNRICRCHRGARRLIHHNCHRHSVTVLDLIEVVFELVVL